MTKDQLFLFDGHLYEQTNGDAMDSPLGPLLANFFMCSTEDTLWHEGKMPTYNKKYVTHTDYHATHNISCQFPPVLEQI